MGQPCGRCVGKGSQCTYVKRLWHLSKPHQEQRQPQPSDRCHTHRREVLLQSSQPGGLASSGKLPLKRLRLNASPTTCLVGMLENAFLSDFFGCIGFLPLTNQRWRRTLN
ncbi:unnamed protein product [Ectocarpus sp. 12 AP-2014]